MASKFVLPHLAAARRQMSGMAIKKIDAPKSHQVEVSNLLKRDDILAVIHT